MELQADPSTRRLFDFLGTAPDGRVAIAEAKVARRKITRATLVSWIAQLTDGARAFPDARLILPITGPGLTSLAEEFATSAPIEIYLERRPGDFECQGR